VRTRRAARTSRLVATLRPLQEDDPWHGREPNGTMAAPLVCDPDRRGGLDMRPGAATTDAGR